MKPRFHEISLFSSALAAAVTNLMKIMRHQGWKSSTVGVTEGYIEDSLETKNLIARKPLTVQTTSVDVASTSTRNAVVFVQSSWNWINVEGIDFTSTININVNK